MKRLPYLLIAAAVIVLDAWTKWLVNARIDLRESIPLIPDFLRSFVAAASYYHQAHALKIQASFAHNVEVEDTDRTGGDATFADATATQVVRDAAADARKDATANLARLPAK